MRPPLDAVLPFAMAHGVLQHHSIVNTMVMFDFLNLAKGSTLCPTGLAIFCRMVEGGQSEEMTWATRQAFYFHDLYQHHAESQEVLRRVNEHVERAESRAWRAFSRTLWLGYGQS